MLCDVRVGALTWHSVLLILFLTVFLALEVIVVLILAAILFLILVTYVSITSQDRISIALRYRE